MAAPAVPAAPEASLPEVAAPPPRPRGTPVTDRGTVVHDEVRAATWQLRGIAKVVHDVDVGAAELHGTVVVGGPLLADELRLDGRLEVRGAIAIARRLRAQGSIDAGAGLRAADATIAGDLRVTGELELNGTARFRGNLQAGLLRAVTLQLDGEVQVPGPVAAERLEAELAAGSRLGEVRATQARLRGPAPNVVRRVLGGGAPVTVTRVEGDTVSLAAVRVGFVKAREIVLGAGAHVAAVEGTVVRRHPSSHLGPEAWTPPPEGLRR